MRESTSNTVTPGGSVWPHPVSVPDEPLRVAIIGVGNRFTVTYERILPALRPWLTVVAVCDPARDRCDRKAELLTPLGPSGSRPPKSNFIYHF